MEKSILIDLFLLVIFLKLYLSKNLNMVKLKTYFFFPNCQELIYLSGISNNILLLETKEILTNPFYLKITWIFLRI